MRRRDDGQAVGDRIADGELLCGLEARPEVRADLYPD
jgi:hypothetical protein